MTTPRTDSDELLAYPAQRDSRCPFDPPPELVERQQAGRLTKVRIADDRAPWLVTRYADQRALLADPRLSSDIRNPGYPQPDAAAAGESKISFILMDDPEHARLRRMVTAPFMVKRIRSMRPRVQQIADQLIDDLLAGPKPADLVDAFALPLPSLVICELLGVPYSDHEFFQENSKVIISRATDRKQSGAAMAALTSYLDELMQRKLTEPGDDLLSGLGERVRAGELSSGEAAQMGMLLLIAGHETTANMIALGTLALLEHPDQLALLRDVEDDDAGARLVASAVEELLRYLTITHNGRRRVATEDIEFDGQVIKAGDGVIFPGDIGNRDPDVFDDPDRLDVTRDARHHVAFGFGVHQCLGQPLARMELQVVYSTLYRRIPTMSLATELESIRFKTDASVYGVRELPISW